MADDGRQPLLKDAKPLDELIKDWRADVEQEHVNRDGARPDALTIAVLSDVHGVSLALDAVLRSAYAMGAKQIWCLGDVVGRGPSPDQCIERFASLGPVLLPVWLIGNHEAMWLDENGNSSIDDLGATKLVIADHRRQLESVLVRRSHPPRFRTVWEWSSYACIAPISNGPTIFAVHGGAPTTFSTPFEVYVDSRQKVESLLKHGRDRASALAIPPPTILLAGHTHVPDAWEWSTGACHLHQLQVRFGRDTPVAGECVYMNVGSSGGFSRGGTEHSTYAILRISDEGTSWSIIEVATDLEPERAKMRSLSYPLELIRELGPQPNLAHQGNS